MQRHSYLVLMDSQSFIEYLSIKINSTFIHILNYKTFVCCRSSLSFMQWCATLVAKMRYSVLEQIYCPVNNQCKIFDIFESLSLYNCPSVHHQSHTVTLRMTTSPTQYVTCVTNIVLGINSCKGH